MEFENKQFNPADQGDVIDLSDLLGATPSNEESISVDLEEPINNEVVEPAPPKVEIPEPPKEDSYFKTLVKKKIESGEWYNVEGLDDIDVDQDTFEEIVTAQLEQAKAEAKEGTIKTDNLSPMMLKALEIDKNGGNVSQVFETYKNIYENPENPISSLDLDNPIDQERLLIYYHKNRGLEDFEIQSIVDGHKKNLTLNKASEKAKQDIDTVFSNYLEQQASQTEQLKTQAQEALKAYRTSITDEAKKYDINDNYRKTLVDKLSKPDEKGVYKIDATYDEWRRDPEKALKLSMFMDNEEEYIKQKASKLINQEKEKVFTSIKLTQKGKGSGTVDINTSKADKTENISLSEI